MKTSGRRVLLVDDDSVITTIFQKRLTKRGFQVECAADGNQIIDKITGSKAEVVLLDIFMPQISGLEVLSEIRKNWPRDDLPVIMVTSLDDTQGVVEAFERGANDYVTKPVSIDVAVARIQAHLSVVDLVKHRMSLELLNRIRALVVTYNHELNNPLQIATASLEMLARDKNVDAGSVHRMHSALQRIAEVTVKIREATDAINPELEAYSSFAQFKLKKSSS